MDKNLKLRILSALILIPLVIFIVIKGGLPFIAFVLVCSIVMLLEWFVIIRDAKNKLLWQITGILYISIPCGMLVWIREIPYSGMLVISWLLATVWSTDIGAYMAGKTIGGRKLAPKISPGKTWSGAIGGTVVGVITSTYLTYKYAGVYPARGIAIGLYLVIMAQLGDLFESWIKRKFNVKDSGNIIPGHGGMLDRLDSLLFVTPAIVLTALIFGLIQ